MIIIPQKFNPHRVTGYIKATASQAGVTPHQKYATNAQLIGSKHATSTQLSPLSLL